MSEFGPKKEDIYFHAPDTGGGSGSGKQKESQDVLQAGEGENETEFELTPEIEAMVMEKVQDINAKYTAISKISKYYPLPVLSDGQGKLESIFRSGLTGTAADQEGINRSGYYNEITSESYMAALKEGKKPDVFFSIVGRNERDEFGVEVRVNDYYSGDNVAIIFDLTGFKEILVAGDGRLERGTFTPYYGSSSNLEDFDDLPHNGANEIMTPMEFGFRLSPRVAPRLFRGVVISMSRELSDQEFEERIQGIRAETLKIGVPNRFGTDINWLRSHTSREAPETRKEVLLERANEIAKVMMRVDVGKPNRLIPIYNVYGDLLWPRQMSYEEVKEFVREREEKKKQEAGLSTGIETESGNQGLIGHSESSEESGRV